MANTDLVRKIITDAYWLFINKMQSQKVKDKFTMAASFFHIHFAEQILTKLESNEINEEEKRKIFTDNAQKLIEKDKELFAELMQLNNELQGKNKTMAENRAMSSFLAFYTLDFKSDIVSMLSKLPEVAIEQEKNAHGNVQAMQLIQDAQEKAKKLQELLDKKFSNKQLIMAELSEKDSVVVIEGMSALRTLVSAVANFNSEYKETLATINGQLETLGLKPDKQVKKFYAEKTPELKKYLDNPAKYYAELNQLRLDLKSKQSELEKEINEKSQFAGFLFEANASLSNAIKGYSPQVLNSNQSTSDIQQNNIQPIEQGDKAEAKVVENNLAYEKYNDVAENMLMLNRAKDDMVISILTGFFDKKLIEAKQTIIPQLNTFLLQLNNNFKKLFFKDNKLFEPTTQNTFRPSFLQKAVVLQENKEYQKLIKAGVAERSKNLIYEQFGPAQAIHHFLETPYYQTPDFLQALQERAALLEKLMASINTFAKQHHLDLTHTKLSEILDEDKQGTAISLANLVDHEGKQLNLIQALELEREVCLQTLKNMQQLTNAVDTTEQIEISAVNTQVSSASINTQTQDFLALLDQLQPSQKIMLKENGSLGIIDMKSSGFGSKGISQDTVAAANKILVAIENSIKAGLPNQTLLFQFIASEWGQNVIKNNPHQLQKVIHLQEEIQTFYTQAIAKINREDFLKITDEEFLKPSDYSKEAVCPNIVNSTKHFNQISDYVVSDILNHPNLEVITAKVALWINVAYRCYQSGNFLGMQAVLSALNATPVYRLLYASNDDSMQAGVIIHGLEQAEQDKLKTLQELINTDGSYKNLRQAISAHTGSFIPPTIIQSDLEFTKRGNPAVSLQETPAAKKVMDLINRARTSLNLETENKVFDSQFPSVFASYTEANEELFTKLSKQVLPNRESHASLQPAQSSKNLVYFKAKLDKSNEQPVDQEVINQIANIKFRQIFIANNKHVSPEMVDLINIQLAKPEALKYGAFYKFIVSNVAKSFILTENQFKAVKAEAISADIIQSRLNEEVARTAFIHSDNILKEVSKNLKPSYLEQLSLSAHEQENLGLEQTKKQGFVKRFIQYLKNKITPEKIVDPAKRLGDFVGSLAKLTSIKSDVEKLNKLSFLHARTEKDFGLLEQPLADFINIHFNAITKNKALYKRCCLQLESHLKKTLKYLFSILDEITSLNKKANNFTNTELQLIEIYRSLNEKYNELKSSLENLGEVKKSIHEVLDADYKEFASLKSYLSG